MTQARDLADLAGAAAAGTITGRNLIINGAMQVAQRGTSSTSSGYQTVDRFRNDFGGASVTQSQQVLSSGDPHDDGFRYFYRHENTATSSATSAQLQVFQFVEAQNIAGSGWNYTSTSSNITVSFWVRSSLAGTYVFNMQSVDGTAQNYSSEFTLLANTWTKVRKTISGNSSLQFDDNAERGMMVNFMVHLGTDYTDSGFTYDSWAAYSGSSRADDFGQNWCNTASATFDITGVQLEVGSTATDFEHRSYGDELARCQRYYEVENNMYVVSCDTTVNGAEYYTGSFAVTKCRNPDVSVTGTWSSSTPTVEAGRLNSYRITSASNFFSNNTGNVVADAEL